MPGPSSPPPRPAELDLSPPADMSEAKNGPEYASFFAVMGASAAMVFSGERRDRRDLGGWEGRGARGSCSHLPRVQGVTSR